MQDLRVGVVGVGHLGRHHARILADLPGVALVGVADIDLSRAEAVAARRGGRAVSDGRALVDDVDAITIAVPTSVHLEVARHFIERGIATLVEKPLAASLPEADQLVAMADQHRASLAVGHTERFNPAVEAALRVIERPRFVEIRRLSSLPERSLDIDVVFDLMIHDLDLLLAFVDSPVVSVEAVGATVLTDKTDLANARIRFASGCIANLTASRISRGRERTLKVYQPDACVAVDCAAQTVELFRLTRGEGRPTIEGTQLEIADQEPLRGELEDFVGAVREGRDARTTGRAGRDAIALAATIADQIEQAGS